MEPDIKRRRLTACLSRYYRRYARLEGNYGCDLQTNLLLKRPQKAEIESVEKVSKTSEGEKFPMAFTSTLHCVNFTPDERIASVVLFCCRRSIIHEEHHDYIQT